MFEELERAWSFESYISIQILRTKHLVVIIEREILSYDRTFTGFLKNQDFWWGLGKVSRYNRIVSLIGCIVSYRIFVIFGHPADLPRTAMVDALHAPTR